MAVVITSHHGQRHQHPNCSEVHRRCTPDWGVGARLSRQNSSLLPAVAL